ncbi:MAG: hypothetical protein ACREQY_23620, partial [Candidatus Binatia bacterium]
LALSACQLAIALVPEGWSGLVRPWTAPNLVYAWSARRVKEPALFLERFEHVYRRLDLHSKSHPPGATLLAYWTQNHSRPASKENVVRLFLLASANVPLVYFLGRSMFDRRRAALGAAAVGAMPTAVTLGTFSQDAVYAVVFSAYLLLVWALGRGPRLVLYGASAGIVLFALTMLTFSWTIAAAGAGLFLLLDGRRSRASAGSVAARLIVPPLVALLCHLGVWRFTGFDYLDSFFRSWSFHRGFYPLRSSWEWTLALAGSQAEILLGLGPLAASAFVVGIGGRAGGGAHSPAYALLWSILFAYSLAIFFGPNPLKFEAARSWYWITTIGALVAADRIVTTAGKDDRPLLLAPAASLVTTAALLLVLDFGV